ncbi:GDSL-type esterase/lipase family protein [Fructobacillus ficulneus]|uniref:SGNH hydrolase-type esterase domain-containing protein n=1 Tax=Fructobacillus ficulneus TaxID=157463 RepID=A0A0K8MIZ2_9LACO|nr:GDSL-type esterase/lipase family protein [Fructobacillus ficulneus]GAP00149.1 hypothetical protein FFIC_281570 [Fructobacillus ficulneus]
MNELELIKLATPEWSATEEGLRTSQYGAGFIFQAPVTGTLSFDFAHHYPDLVWTLAIDGQDQDQILVANSHLDLHLQGGHDYQLTLDQWQTGQVAFWQTGLIITAANWDGDSDLVPALKADNEQSYLTFVGDSITAGEFMEGSNHDSHRPSQSFPALVAKHFGQRLNRIAYGGTGLTSRAPFQEPKAIDALWQVGPGISRRRVQTKQVVVAYGLNDGNYGATDQEFAFGLRVYLLELVKRFHGAHFYLLTPWNGAFVEIFNQEVARFDNFTVVPAHEWGVKTRPNHPGLAAHQLMAEKIAAVLED